MRKFKIGDKVIFTEDEDIFIYEYAKISLYKEYTILKIYVNDERELCSIENDCGKIMDINVGFLLFSPSYLRNEVINDILN